MKVVTFNAGLLSLRLPGGLKAVEPAAWVEERLACMPAALTALHADVLLLQEVYSPLHKRVLAHALADVLPYAAYNATSPRWRLLPDSLMILSRYPMAEAGFVRFRTARLDERLLDTKGFFCAHMPVTPVGPLFVLNVHATAGLLSHPENGAVDAVRAAQIDEVVDHALGHAGPANVLLGGDFNCGPGVADDPAQPVPALVLRSQAIAGPERVSMANYRRLALRGFADTHRTLGLPEAPTWSPKENPLNVGGDHAVKQCCAQRIDHVHVKPGQLRPIGGGLCLNDPVVPLPEGSHVPLSDHYGYWVELLRG